MFSGYTRILISITGISPSCIEQVRGETEELWLQGYPCILLLQIPEIIRPLYCIRGRQYEIFPIIFRGARRIAADDYLVGIEA